jgi:hypothetical protein
MATSPLFGWEEPDDTDLVKDGAAAIRTLGNAIDTSMGDLLGGTSGQVLSKNSNTNMDFTWVTSDDANAIQNAIVDAKGDLIAATAADTPARLAVGANDTMLVGDSTAATGLSYKSAATLYPWQTWTPSYTRLTIGNGTVVARYQQIGKTVNFFWKLTWGSTTSVVNYPVISPPVNGNITANQYPIGLASLNDVSVVEYAGSVNMTGGNGLLISSINSAGTSAYYTVLDSGTPATWTTNDIWTITGTYEGV